MMLVKGLLGKGIQKQRLRGESSPHSPPRPPRHCPAATLPLAPLHPGRQSVNPCGCSATPLLCPNAEPTRGTCGHSSANRCTANLLPTVLILNPCPTGSTGHLNNIFSKPLQSEELWSCPCIAT